MNDHDAVRIRVRDDLLAAVITKLKARRDTQALAAQVQRLVTRIAAIEDTEHHAADRAAHLASILDNHIAIFAKRTGGERPPSHLRSMKLTLPAREPGPVLADEGVQIPDAHRVSRPTFTLGGFALLGTMTVRAHWRRRLIGSTVVLPRRDLHDPSEDLAE